MSSSQRRAPTFSLSIFPSLPCSTSHLAWSASWTKHRTTTPSSSNLSAWFSPDLLNCQEKLLGWAGQLSPALPLSFYPSSPLSPAQPATGRGQRHGRSSEPQLLPLLILLLGYQRLCWNICNLENYTDLPVICHHEPTAAASKHNQKH